jgi:hypothetical protein
LKDLLKADILTNIDKEQYFDPKKRIYSAVPVFPFLSLEDIEVAIEGCIDKNSLKEEISELAKSNADSIIPDTAFIITLIDWHTYPNLILLLTITREWAFRNEGGGTGGRDFDSFDSKPFMKQLIILNPGYESEVEAIIGGYRYAIHNADTYAHGPMGDHFHFSDQWKSDAWVELGRSFINPYFQQKEKRQSFDYVLHGLGFIYAKNPQIRGYFGKVTLYNIYELQGADKYFLAVAKKYFRNSDEVYVLPEERVAEGELTEEQTKLLDRDPFKGLFYSLRNDYNINLVPIMAIYNRMVDLHNMYGFGAFRHDDFGNTTEFGIAIDVDEIYDIIIEKFVEPYT